MFWPILLLYLDKEATQEHSMVFHARPREESPKKTQEDEPEDDPFDPCNTGTLQVRPEDRGSLPDTGVWAVCAYQAAVPVPTAWPLRLAVAADE